MTTGNVLLQADVAFTLAASMEETGDLEEADQLAERAADLFKRGGEWKGVAHAWTMRGEIARSRWDWSAASDFGRRAVKLARTTNAAGVEADASHLLGKIELKQRNLDAARQWAARALDCSHVHGSRLGAAAAWNLFGLIEHRDGALATANEHALKALAIQRSMQDINGTSSTLVLLAEIALDQEKYDEAQALATEALDLDRRGNADEDTAGCMTLLALIEHRRGNVAQARSWVEQIQEIVTAAQHPGLEERLSSELRAAGLGTYL